MKSKMKLGLRIKKFLRKFSQGAWGLIQRHQFAFLVSSAVLVAAILTTISVVIYVMSGAINIDLSRPGYESVRDETADAPEDDMPFSSSGKIDDDARNDFLRRLEAYQTEMNQMNDFGGDSLSDKSLNLE